MDRFTGVTLDSGLGLPVRLLDARSHLDLRQWVWVEKTETADNEDRSQKIESENDCR
jgi:hypothetical protein